MAKLTEDIRRFIIMELAVYRTQSEVVDRVKEEFGLDITRQQVNDYHPERAHGGKLPAKKWVKLYHETRDAFDKSAKDIPVAKAAYRLRELNDNYLKALKMKNLRMANAILEQASKESGGAYTNRRELTGKDGKDLPAGGAVVILPAKAEIEKGESE
jgi:hypothetical protein